LALASTAVVSDARQEILDVDFAGPVRRAAAPEADSRLPIHLVARVFVGVMPFAGMMGFLTPMLVDRWSSEIRIAPAALMRSTFVGCIVGPALRRLSAWLPLVGEQLAMLRWCWPWFAMVWPRMARFFGPLVRAAGFAWSSVPDTVPFHPGL